MKPPEPTSRPDPVGIGYNRLKIQKNPFPISKDVRKVLGQVGLIVITKDPQMGPFRITSSTLQSSTGQSVTVLVVVARHIRQCL